LFQITGFLIVQRPLSRKSIAICIGVTFSLMLPIEWWATQNGVWIWSDSVTFYKIGNIPFEELMLYVSSAVTTVILFEFFFGILNRR